MASNIRAKWLEELLSQSNTIQAQEDMTRRASSVWAWTRRVIPVKEHMPSRRIHNHVWGTTVYWWYLLIPLVDLNEIKMASKLHMYLDSCKGASLYIHLAMSYQGNKVRHMRADLWKVRFSSFEARIQHRIQVSEENLVCWRTMLIIVTRRASSVWAWTRRVTPVKEHMPSRRIHNYVWADHGLLMISLDSSGRFKWE